MPTLRHEPFPRPQDLSDRSDPAVLYVRSYLLTRTVVGVLGVLLPVALVAGEAFGVPTMMSSPSPLRPPAAARSATTTWSRAA